MNKIIEWVQKGYVHLFFALCFCVLEAINPSRALILAFLFFIVFFVFKPGGVVREIIGDLLEDFIECIKDLWVLYAIIVPPLILLIFLKYFGVIN